MLSKRIDNKGFSMAEVLIVIALLGILASVVVINFGNNDTKAKETSLKSNLATMRTAVDMYRSDHGFLPGSSDDDGYPLTSAEFQQKFTLYTNAAGETNTTKTTAYKYGPYMDNFPVEPFGNVSTVTFKTTTSTAKSSLTTTVAASDASGGWYYECESGVIIANLGSTFPGEYAGF